MAALVRQGASRRLGGSMVKRAEAQGRRLMHTEDGPRRPLHTMHPDEVLREIKQKKEELYDAIANVDDICKTMTNMRLHLHLAAEITPRPHDLVWEDYNFSRRTYSLLKKVGLLTLPFTVPSCWEYYRGYRDDKKVAPAMMREEEHGAISSPI